MIFENNGSNYKKRSVFDGEGEFGSMLGRVHSREWRRNREKSDVRPN